MVPVFNPVTHDNNAIMAISIRRNENWYPHCSQSLSKRNDGVIKKKNNSLRKFPAYGTIQFLTFSIQVSEKWSKNLVSIIKNCVYCTLTQIDARSYGDLNV